MKATIIGYARMTGTSDKGPYDMPRLHILTPQEPMERENFKRVAGGFSAIEVPCQPEVIQSLNGSKFPREVELDTAVKGAFGRLETTVTAVKG